MKKRILSLFLALTLCLTLLPTAAFAEGKTGGEDGTSDGSEPQYVAQIGETKYETMQDALDEMSENEITLLGNVTEDLTVYAATTIHMNGFSITGDIDATDSLTLENGTVIGNVTVDCSEDDGAFTMTAPADAEAAIDGGLNVVSGSCSVSGAKVGVKDTLVFGDDSMVITGIDKAVELDAAVDKQLYGSTNADGDAAEEASFKDGTYQVSGGVAKKLSNKQEGGSAPVEPASLTLTPETANVAASETATFTATYTGTGTLNAYIQKNGLDQNFGVSTPTNNGDGTYTITVKIAEETPTGDYTLYVHETKDTSVQAMAKIHVKGKDPVAEVIHPGAMEGTKYFSLPAALDAAQDGDTVKLLADHTTNWSDVEASEYSTLAVIKKTLTLDLNGKTVDYLEVGEVVPDEEGGILESTDGNLTVMCNGSTLGKITDLNFVKGTLDIQGGVIGTNTSSTEGNSGQFTCHGNSGSVTISGGTVYGVTVGEGASVTVSGGSMHEGNWFNDGTLTITGGTFGNVSFRNNGGTIAISGGTFGEITNTNANGKISVAPLLADECAFYGKDASGDYTVLQNSSKTTLENVKVLEHTEHSFLNGACIACGALTCDKSNNGEEGGCIAHVTILHYTWHIKTLDQIAYHLSAVGQWSGNYPTVTVEFLSDVTTDTSFRIEQCLTYATLDLDGHTISGELSGSPVAEVNYLYGVHCVIIQNGTIENTAENGTALQLSSGATTLENVDVKGNLALTYTFASSANYTPTFLGGGSFTRIHPVANDVNGKWSKKLSEMLGEGCWFLDSAGDRINANKWLGSTDNSNINELVNVRVKACDHKDADGKYTLFENAEMRYGSLAKRCTVCGNLCPHDEITEGQNPTCVACGLPIVIKTTNLLNGKAIGPWYYTGLNDAMYEILHVNKGRRPTLELLADTESDSSYEWMTNDYDGIFIDLAGHTLKLTGDQNKASYWVTIQNTSDTHAEVRGTVNVYHKDSRSKLVILDTDNNLTIETVKFVDDGTAELAGGSFGKITVPTGKPLASLLVSGYYFADSNSTTGAPAALYDADGNALTELTNVTVRLCSHDEAVYGSGGTWVCPCGQKTFVASITKGEATTYYTDLQEAFSAADASDTVKLLAAASGTANINKVFALDLNGYGAEEINVSAKATIKDSGETKGMIGKLTVSADGLTIGDLLEMGYAFKYENGNWMSNDRVTEGSSIAVHLAPIASVTLRAKDADGEEVSTTMPYGTTGAVRLDAACGQPYGATQATCVITKIEGGTMTSVSNFPGYTLPDDLTAGEHTYRVTFTSDGYSKSAEITITVTPVSLAGAIVAVGDLTYNGDAQTPEVTVTLDKKVLTKDKDYTLTGAEQTNAGSYHLTVTGKGGYEGEIGNVDWKIEPKTVTNPTINVAPCVYNGFEQTPRVELKDGERGIPEGEYTVAYSNNINAGDGSLTIQDAAGGNYVVSGSTTFPIEQASINTSNRWIEVRVFNELAKTYEVELQPNLDNILYEQRIDGTFGTVTYSLDEDGASTYADYYELGTAKIENGKLILPIKNGSGVPSGNYIVTLMLRVESTNFKSFDLPVHIIARDKIVPRLAEGSTVSATDITYGQTLADSMLTVTGSMEAPSFDAPGTIQEVTGTFAWTDGTIRPEAGDYEAEWTFTPDASNGGIYANATGKVSVKVNPKDIKGATVTLKSDSFEYDGTRKDPEVASVVLDGETLVYGQYSDYGYHYDMASDVGTYNLVVGGNHNYTGSVSVTWSITPKTVTPTIEVASCSYTGDTLTPDVTLTDDIGNTIDPKEYTVSYSNNTNAGTGTVTIKDAAGGNYVLNEASTTFTITKAAAPTLEDIVISHKYTVTTGEKTIGSTMPVDAGALSFTKGTESTTGSVTVSSWAVDAATGKVTYTLSSGTAGDTVTLPVTISSTNYADTVINVVITLTRRDDQKPLTIIGDTSVIYGEKLTLTTTGGSGTGAVTYRVDTDHITGEATIDPNTGVLTPVKVGSVSVIATKEGDKDYNDVTSAPFVLMIKPATPSGEPNYTKITTSGKTLADAQLTVGTITPAGTISWDAGDTQSVAANTAYNWTFKPTDTVNYNNLTGSITPYTVSHSGGGGGSSHSSRYAITVDKTENGTITVSPKSASKGDTVTITVKPDKGYELDTLKVLDKDGDRVKLTEKNGKYTFVMPASKVIVKGSFAAEAPEQIFFDVPVNAYYYNAVKWAADKGITGGVSPTLFAPDQPCTRAQIVTFLWRAAGSPAPKSTAMAFTDVPAGSYYYDAVLWAIENGVTKGTSDTTFSPNANCSRGQIVTFLWRSQKSPDAAAANPFTDVAADAYYISAVLWAVERNITGGTSATTFSPSANCTRAQIVTFIYRCMK